MTVQWQFSRGAEDTCLSTELREKKPWGGLQLAWVSLRPSLSLDEPFGTTWIFAFVAVTQ